MITILILYSNKNDSLHLEVVIFAHAREITCLDKIILFYIDGTTEPIACSLEWSTACPIELAHNG